MAECKRFPPPPVCNALRFAKYTTHICSDTQLFIYLLWELKAGRVFSTTTDRKAVCGGGGGGGGAVGGGEVEGGGEGEGEREGG